MSSELGSVKDIEDQEVKVIQYCGGEKNGLCFQITGSDGRINLTRDNMIKLINILDTIDK